MKYTILTTKEDKKWIDFLEYLPFSQKDIYYTPDYYKSYEKYGGGKAICFAFENNGELALYPFLLNSVNNLGFKLKKQCFDIQGAYGYNGVVSSSYSSDFINSFHKSFDEYCNENNIIAEFTRFNPYINNKEFSKGRLSIILNRRTVLLELNNSFEDIWNNAYSSNNRNMIRKAMKKKYSIYIDNSINGVSVFKDLYLMTMKKIGALEYYNFTESFFTEMSMNGHFKYLFVKDSENTILATMILIVFGKYSHYHLSGRNLEVKDNSVNNFMLNEAIKIAKQYGAEFFHFGGGNTINENDPLFRFKKGFSKLYLDFYIGKKIHNYAIYEELMNQWKKKDIESFYENSGKVLGYRPF